MRSVVEAFGNADFRPLLDALDENVVWKSAATQKDGPFRFGGAYVGKASVIELLSRLSTAYFFKNVAAKEIISSGEVLWGLFDLEATYLPVDHSASSPKPLQIEMAMRWRVRGGKIVEVSSFLDTALLLALQRQQTRE